jgi:hypothetical protein
LCERHASAKQIIKNTIFPDPYEAADIDAKISTNTDTCVGVGGDARSDAKAHRPSAQFATFDLDSKSIKSSGNNKNSGSILTNPGSLAKANNIQVRFCI